MDTQQRSTRDIALPIVLIGPVNAGKSTIGQLLAQRLGAGRASLDEVCWPYFEEAGYDEGAAREHYLSGGQAGAHAYMQQFYPGAVERVVHDYPDCVIDLGAGHTVYDDPGLLAQARRALVAVPHVVLLLPSPDLEESIRVLAERDSNPHPEIVIMNEEFVRHPANRSLATLVVYTAGKTPEETCDWILACLQ